MALILNELPLIVNVIFEYLFTIIIQSLSLILTIYIIFKKDTIIGGMTLILIPCTITLLKIFDPIIKTNHLAVLNDYSSINRKLQENIVNLKEIRYLKAFDFSKKRFELTLKSYKISKYKLIFLDLVYRSLLDLMHFFPFVILLIYGQIRIQSGSLTVGTLVALTTYLQRVFAPLKVISSNYQSLQKGLVTLERHDKYVATLSNGECESKKILNSIDSISFEKVTFKYGDKYILNDFSLKIEKGEIIQFVGSNGCGKTTIIDLIFGLIKPNCGVIKFNDVPIDEFNHFSTMEKMSIIPQNSAIFNDSIENNIVLSREVSLKRIDEIDNSVNFLNSLGNRKLDSILEAFGNDLSAGQRKKISIIRSLVIDSDLLVMDEPMANLDHLSKEKLRLFLKEHCNDKIVVLVSHEDNFDFINRKIYL